MFCANCGKKLEDGWNTCPNCGCKIEQHFSGMEMDSSMNDALYHAVEPESNYQGFSNPQKKKSPIGIIIAGIVLAVAAIGLIIFAITNLSGKGSKGDKITELYQLRNLSESELISTMDYEKNAGGFYPSDQDVIFSCKDGKIIGVFLGEKHKDDDTFLGVKLGDDAEKSKDRFVKGFKFIESKAGDDGFITDRYTEDKGVLMVKSDMQTGVIESISYAASSNQPKPVEKTSAKKETETIPTEKIQVKDDGYDTVVTAKSQNLDFIQLYKTPGGSEKAGKVQEGVCCAQLDKRKVDGESWVLIDFCDIQGWCKEDKIRTVSGRDAKYFYVRDNGNNTVFVNEKEIKLHSEAKQSSDTPVTGVEYGTELTITEVRNGWGHTTYKSKDCWVDMNVVGFYCSEYWQVERADGSTTGIKLRKLSSEDSDEIMKVPLKTVVHPSEYKDGWAKIKYDGETGWLKLHYATPCGSDSGIKSEDKTDSTQQTKKTEQAAKSEPSHHSTYYFADYCYPTYGSYYSYNKNWYLYIYNVTSSSFSFYIEDPAGYVFNPHTAYATSGNTAIYYGMEDDLAFVFDAQGVGISGFGNKLGNGNYFYKY